MLKLGNNFYRNMKEVFCWDKEMINRDKLNKTKVMSDIIGKEELLGCEKKILVLVDFLDSYAKRKKTQLIVTSGKRNGTRKSWHNVGLAVDFCFIGRNVFEDTSALFRACKEQRNQFEGVTEFEVSRRNWDKKQHFHIAFGEEGRLESFTGIYKK